jgi:hypothetical protein
MHSVRPNLRRAATTDTSTEGAWTEAASTERACPKRMRANTPDRVTRNVKA